MDYWPLLTPLGGFDFSKLKYHDQNEIDSLRKLFRKKKFSYHERLPCWWEPETPGRSGMSSFGSTKKESVNVRKNFRRVNKNKAGIT